MEVRSKITRAFLRLLKKDAHLLVVEANERSITHRFAVYIEDEFPDFDVDCEFNRKGNDPKRLKHFRRKITSANTKGVSVFPDVIVHLRGTRVNHLVIEAKTKSNAEDCSETQSCKCDLCKLRSYKVELGYTHAFYIVFPVGRGLKEFKESCLVNHIREIP
jgi:hypothetical protein